jgi:branched-chain amino acid transport system permease protein
MSTETVRAPAMRTGLAVQLGRRLPALVVLAVSLALLAAIAVQAGPAQIINIVVTGGMWAMLSAGLALVLGVMNVSHFAHGESFMVGAYAAYFVFTPLRAYLEKGDSGALAAAAPFVGIVAAGLAGAVLGFVIERFVFRPLRQRTQSGWVMNTFLVTVGLSFVMTNGTNLALGPNFRGIPRYWNVPPLALLGVRVAVDRIVAFFIAVIVITALWFFLQRTRTGRAIRAVSQDETGAEIVGINLNQIYALTFALATAMAAIAGACLLFMFQAYPTVGLKPLYFSWYVVMLVGLGNVAGAVIGGFIVALLQTATQQFVGIAWEDVVPTAIMILVLLVAPSGIFGSEVKGVQEQ